jgi:hypothetical protein
MVTVCAWCQRFLGLKEPFTQGDVSHGICPTCSARQRLEDVPTLVVSRSRVDTVPILEGLLTGTPEIRIVVDRRLSDRRRGRSSVDVPGGRRMRRDRREKVTLFLT